MSVETRVDSKPARSTVHGLATVAMLKVNFDAGRDHIAMFEPFVRDAVATFPADDMDLMQVNAAVKSRHDLSLPVNTMRTLLSRIVRQGYLTRGGGRYFRTDKRLRSDDVLENRKRAERRQRRLADGLIALAAEHRVKIETSEDALALIMEFMESYHVSLAFDEPPQADDSQLEDTSGSPKGVITALFLREAILAEGEFAEVVQEMLEGFVLQNTLLLKDIAAAGRQFQNLEVIADSKILFGALGLRGPTAKVATLELIDLLKKTGAGVSAFTATIKEMKGILMVYEEKLATPKGREELRPSELTQHFFAEGFTPADVRQRASLLELNLKAVGIPIRKMPDRVPSWTLDEKALAARLADERENEPRVIHDVDCVAGVLTYRRGKTSDSLDSARSVFATTSGMTVKQTRHWYYQQGLAGFPPIIHVQTLSNYAWLKRPASAATLKAHELVALCSAALRPSRRTWEHFVEHLRSLERSGELSSDEVAAVVASELTQNVLAEEGIDEESDSRSMSEVVERVRAEERKEVDAAHAVARMRAAEVSDLRERMSKRAETIARIVSRIIFGLLALSLVAGTAVSLVQAATGKRPSLLPLVLALVPLAICSLFAIFNGTHLRHWQGKTEAWLKARLERWMLHGSFCPPE